MSASVPSTFLRSLQFWIPLLVAAGVFALVVLAPKVVHREQLTSAHAANAQRLYAMKHQIEYLEQAADFLQRDPAYVARMTGVERTDDVSIRDVLHYAPPSLNPPLPQGPGESRLVPAIQLLALDPAWRCISLLLAAALVLWGFTEPAGFQLRKRRGGCGSPVNYRLRGILNRYRPADQ